MSTPVIIVGAGGHGRVVAEIVQCSGATVLGFVDDGLSAGTSVLGLPVIGPMSVLAQQPRPVSIALGIGDNARRRAVACLCFGQGLELRAWLHPTAVVSVSARIGRGSVVGPLAVVNPEAQLGDGVIVNSAAVVEHECVVGDFAHLSPNSAMAGRSRVGQESHLGIGACTIQGVRIGARTVIGAGSVVTRDIGDDVVAFGSPARVIRSNDPPSRSHHF